MKILQSFILISILFTHSICYASCVGPFCWDDTGASISGVKFNGTFGGGTGSPGGGDLSLQFNDNGSFGGATNITVDDDNDAITGLALLQGDSCTINLSHTARIDLIGTSGVVLPLLTTTQRNAILLPPEGTMIVNTSSHTLEFYNGSAWRSINTSAT